MEGRVTLGTIVCWFRAQAPLVRCVPCFDIRTLNSLLSVLEASHFSAMMMHV
jgi:hypothetical protein